MPSPYLVRLTVAKFIEYFDLMPEGPAKCVCVFFNGDVCRHIKGRNSNIKGSQWIAPGSYFFIFINWKFIGA